MANILLIDDQGSMLNITRQMLQNRGHNVTTASSGEAGLKIFKQNPAAIDLVLTDINISDLNGFQIAQLAKQEKPNLPVVFLTGMSDEQIKILGDATIANAIIKKPFLENEAIAVIEKALKSI